MKECRQIHREIADYASGVLRERARARIEWHLARCAACRRDYEIEKRLEALLASEVRAGCGAPGPDLSWETIGSSLEKESAEDRGGRLKSLISSWRIGLRETLLPRTARHLAECAYWGKILTVPAISIMIAVMAFSALQRRETFLPDAAPEVSGKVLAIRISFQQSRDCVAEGYLVDTSESYRIHHTEKGNLQYGWR